MKINIQKHPLGSRLKILLATALILFVCQGIHATSDLSYFTPLDDDNPSMITEVGADYEDFSESCTPTITFENAGCETVEIYLYYFGYLYYARTLYPGEEYDQLSYEHDIWLVYTESGYYLGYYEAGCDDDHVSIDSGGDCCEEDGGSIALADGNDATTICVDGVPDPLEVTLSGGSSTNSAWVITDDELNILALPPAPPFDLDGAGIGTCLIWYLAFDEVHGAEVGGNAGYLTGCFDLSNPITVYRNGAAWDHVNKGQDADCGSCNGSLIIDANFNLTGKFMVRYTLNGETFEEGPFMSPNDIAIEDLCAGTYTNITIVGVDTGCENVWQEDITLGEEGCCDVMVNDITLADGSTSTSICVDGIGDPLDVTTNGGTGSDSGWIITDDSNNILAMPPAPPFDLDGAGPGTCLIWYVRYDDIEGNMMGNNLSDLTGCFALSNPLTVIREEPDGGTISLADGSTETTICVDGVPDPLDVTISGSSSTNSAWVITDADLNILALPPASPFDLDGAGIGTCLIWYLAFDEVQGAMVGMNAGDLSGCFDLSNPITVDRVDCCDEEGGSIALADGSTETTICVDGVPDPLDVTISGSSATNSAWVITDADLNILALPPAPPFDLDGAGIGTCLIWYLAFDEVQGAMVGMNAGDLSGCFDLSNPITVARTCCDADGNPAECPSDECVNYTLDFNDSGIVHTNDTSGSYTVGNQTFNINIEDDNNVLEYNDESNAGISVGIEPNNRDDVAVITYQLSEVASNIAFDIVDLDYKTGGSKQQEKVCVYGLLGNDDTQIMPTIESLDGSVAINGNCATATTNSALGHDESILVTFDECIDQIVIVYGSGPDAPDNPDFSRIHIGRDLGFSTDVCSGQCTVSQTCEDYTLDFEDNDARWNDNATSDEYDLGGQNISIDIEDNDNILGRTIADDSGLQIGTDPNSRQDEVVITYTLSEVSSHVLFDIVDLDYKTGGSEQQEKVCVYGLLGDDDTQIMPSITSLDGSVAINGNCATATTNSALGHDESVLVEFTECIDQVVIVYGSGPDAPDNSDFGKITIGEDFGFTTEVCPDGCESGSQPREDESFAADVSIFPNPVSESFVTLSIESELQGTANLVLIDALGRTLNNIPIGLTGSLTQYQLDVSGLSGGVYFVTVVAQEGRSKAQQLVVVRP